MSNHCWKEEQVRRRGVKVARRETQEETRRVESIQETDGGKKRVVDTQKEGEGGR